MDETKRENEYYIGVDFGGTKILSGVFNNKFECIGSTKISTKSYRGVDAVITRIAKCILEAVDECDLNINSVSAIGIGAPGIVDPEKGVVIFAPNLHWKDVPLKQEIENILKVPVVIDNDVNICTLGVYETEFEIKPSSLIGIFIGTGIGGGIIINGKLYSGFNKTAGEIGHIVIDVNGPKCGCGNHGCFEALASRSAIFRNIKQAVKNGEKTILSEILGNELEDLKSGDLRKAIKRGDDLVLRIVKEASGYIGIAVANLINILSPEVVVLGGGVIEALEDKIMPLIIETINKNAFPHTTDNVKIVASKLGDDAGIVGAAILAKNYLKLRDV